MITAALSHPGPARAAGRAAAAGRPAARPLQGRASDFLTWLNLWRYVRTQQRELCSSAFRRMCRAEHLNYLRVREWQDVRVPAAADRQAARADRRACPPTSRTPTASTRRCCPGCSRTSGCATPTSATTSAPAAPGSRSSRVRPCSKSAPLVMAAELVETCRLCGRVNAAIAPEWAEELGAHLVKRSYSEPHWSKKRASVLAHERVTLYGVPLVADRWSSYGKVDPAVSPRAVRPARPGAGRVARPAPVLRTTTASCSRRPRSSSTAPGATTSWSTSETLFDFYDARVAAEVVSGAHFDTWWKPARQRRPGPAHLRPGDAGQRVRRRGRRAGLPGRCGARATWRCR